MKGGLKIIKAVWTEGTTFHRTHRPLILIFISLFIFTCPALALSGPSHSASSSLQQSKLQVTNSCRKKNTFFFFCHEFISIATILVFGRLRVTNCLMSFSKEMTKVNFGIFLATEAFFFVYFQHSHIICYAVSFSFNQQFAYSIFIIFCHTDALYNLQTLILTFCSQVASQWLRLHYTKILEVSKKHNFPIGFD